MQHAPAQEPGQNLEMNLREQLLGPSGSQGGGAASPYPLPPASAAAAQSAEHLYQRPGSAGPHENIGASGPGSQQHQQMQYGADNMSNDGQGSENMSAEAKAAAAAGKRELSTSKRAAQNRAAQRAFRQRKEGYIKKLEEQVEEFKIMETNYRTLQNENYQLREYILNLQSRLLENQSDFPPAPSQSTAAIRAPEASTTSPSGRPEPRDQDHRLRSELEEHSRNVPPAPLAPIMEPPRAEPPRHDGMSHLQAAAARAGELEDRRQQHESPYGLGSEYPVKRSRVVEGAPDRTDTEMRAPP